MVRKRADNGSYYHEPPYTWEEEMAIYKGMDIDGPATILHGRSPPASAAPPRPPGSRRKPEAR